MKETWEPMELAEVGSVGDVLRVSVGGGKPSIPTQPDYGQEIMNSPPGQE